MTIKQTRVRVIPKAIASLGVSGPLVFAIPYDERFDNQLNAIGLITPLAVNRAILPQDVGPVTRFNAEGKGIVHRDRPKETAYRQIEWTWEQWNGPYTETVTEIREVPYERYPRTFVPPPGVELSVLATLDNALVIATPAINLQQANAESVCHMINIMLEAFGECDVYREDLSRIVRAPVRRLNWRALPPGRRTWEELEPDLRELIERQPQGNQSPLIFRLKEINDKSPDFVAIGEAGFRDYVVFGFTNRNLFILESPMIDNATYVFGSDWESLARLTKTDLIAGNLIRERLIHRNNWSRRVAALFR